MIITKIHIKRFRSILNLELEINELSKFITICGANNTGKTNVFRALNIFFNPDEYIDADDSPNHKFHGSRGGTAFPEITIYFRNKNNESLSITRKFALDEKYSTIGKNITK